MNATTGTLTLLVEKGPLRGTAVPIARGDHVTIGRRPGVGLVLTGDDFVSPEHADIVHNDHGMSLRNRSGNGTLLNGRPVDEAPLSVNDRISIGLVHLVRVCETTPAAAAPHRGSQAPSAESGGADGLKGVTRPLGIRVPWWLAAYLIAILCAGAFFGSLKLRESSQGLSEIRAQELQYGARRALPPAETGRLLHLLDTAAVHEKRGDLRSAYEAYREVLAARQPVDARSPAYRYAASRASALRVP